MKNKIPIFLASDDNYASFVATTIVSIVYNTDSFVDFYILDSGISDINKRKIEILKDDFNNFSIEYIKIDLKKKFGHFPLHNQCHTLNVFSRYLIPQLKTNLNKVLYLDVDIIVRGDIAELYNSDLKKYHLGAIPEYTNVLDKHKKELGLPDDHKYFNAGILLIDCDFFRENNLTDVLVQKTLEIQPWLQDQDIFNIHFQNDYKVLDYKYNVSRYMYDYNEILFNEKVQKAIKDPFIIHYSTFKPWNDMNVLFSEYFWKYARMTVFYEELFVDLIGKNLNKNEEVNKIEENIILIKNEIVKKNEEIKHINDVVFEKNNQINLLQSSKTFKLGDLFFRSVKSPYKLVTFPVNFLRILVNK